MRIQAAWALALAGFVVLGVAVVALVVAIAAEAIFDGAPNPDVVFAVVGASAGVVAVVLALVYERSRLEILDDRTWRIHNGRQREVVHPASIVAHRPTGSDDPSISLSLSGRDTSIVIAGVPFSERRRLGLILDGADPRSQL